MKNIENLNKLIDMVEEETLEYATEFLTIEDIKELTQKLEITEDKKLIEFINKIAYEEITVYRGKEENIVTEYLEDRNIYVSEIPAMVLQALNLTDILNEEEKNGYIVKFSHGIIAL